MLRLDASHGQLRMEIRRRQKALFGASKSGYPKDIVKWQDQAALLAPKSKSDCSALGRSDLIASAPEAEEHFGRPCCMSAGLVSYAGRGPCRGPRCRGLLSGKKFKPVFDYRDNSSLTPSRPGIEEIFENIEGPDRSRRCIRKHISAAVTVRREAQAMADRANTGALTLVGIRLGGGCHFARVFSSHPERRGWQMSETDIADEVVRIWIRFPKRPAFDPF